MTSCHQIFSKIEIFRNHYPAGFTQPKASVQSIPRKRTPIEMNILIEFGGYSLANLGDFAMLEVTVARVKKIWPTSQIKVFTNNPQRLKELCPIVDPIDTKEHPKFNWASFAPKKLKKYSTRVGASDVLDNLEWKIPQVIPGLAQARIGKKINHALADESSISQQLRAVQEADLIISSGGGYVTDTFPRKIERTLSILNLGVCLGKPTVMLGHGIGPIKNETVKVKAGIVLPKISFISLREKRRSLPLLRNLGVDHQRIKTTGDDAIELAYQNRNQDYGHGIGVNLRIAKYSNIEPDFIKHVCNALHTVARQKEVPLYPVPICHHPDENDPQAIQTLLAGYDDTSDGGQSLDTPLKIAKQAGRCRVVITGSYHAGVFSLSQGVPVVALAKSAYYQDKFLGLAEQFGTGCQVVFLNDPDLENTLRTAIEKAWDSIDTVRPELLSAAKRQIAQGHEAYQQVHHLFENSRRK